MAKSGNGSGRNPRDLQALLKFCAEVTKSEDAPEASLAAMDPERRRWLEDALKAMTVDVFEELTKGVAILNDENKHDEEAQIHALECIEDWIGRSDVANNFDKIGGFDALKKCVERSPRRPRAAADAFHVVAELAQNNPYCQRALVDAGFLKLALDALGNIREDRKVRLKALYAVSCIVRDCDPAFKELLALNGLEVIVKALTEGEDDDAQKRLRTKSCFLLSSLSSSSRLVKSTLTEMAASRLMASMVVAEKAFEADFEHVLKLFFALLVEDEDSRTSLASVEMRNVLAMAVEKSDVEEVVTLAKQIEILLFGSKGENDVNR